MKIGIVTSWFENLALFKFLSKYDFDYHIYWDWNNWPYGDKWFEYSLGKVEQWVKFLIDKWVDFIIVSPVYELYIDNPKILKLFSSYLFDNCFSFSLVWKIWLIWDFSDIQVIQEKLKDISKDYVLSENQRKVKKFNFPFAFWNKEVGLWKSFLTKITFRSFTISKIIKFDLKYFKDACIDTLIPLNYGYFLYERLIKGKINQNKTRFHWIDKLEECFKSIIKNWELRIESWENYWVTFYTNWTLDILLNEKKWIWLLQRWNNTKIDTIKI